MVGDEMGHVNLRRAFGWLLACWSVVALAAKVERQDPSEWLRAMAEAMQRLDYQATLAYSRDNRIQTLRLVHDVKDGVVRERFQALNDSLRVVVREANKVTCYFPEWRTMTVESRDLSHSLLREWPTQWLGDAKFYRLALGRQGRVAERAAQEIMIEPLDAYRYGRRIWLDVESKLPLQLELLDPEDRVLEAFVVTELIVGDVGQQAADLESRPDGGAEPWKVLDRVEVPADRRWRLTQLPQGFTEVKRSRRKDLTDSAPVDHILVTDGLASVSVYIKQQGEDSELDSASRRLGAVNVYNRRIDGYLVTVLGDVPPETVRLIGDGVQEAESTLE